MTLGVFLITDIKRLNEASSPIFVFLSNTHSVIVFAEMQHERESLATLVI